MGSSSNPLVLEPATIQDVHGITEVWFASFTQPVIGQFFPNTPGMRQWHRDWHMADIQKSHCRYLRVVDPESKDEQGRPRIVAFGKWDLAMPDERGRRFPIWHADSPYEQCEAFITELEQARKRVMGDEKHYYLDTLGTHPDYQRRGAGSMLVQWGCDLADKDGVAAYVDASKEGVSLYQKHGFVDFNPPDADVAAMARRKVAPSDYT
ncbi:Acyl-CoA N-acyltransferase [Penicillium expansum]|nr:Acyl-CoA N-acyltransferase [Penicillium expansum]